MRAPRIFLLGLLAGLVSLPVLAGGSLTFLGTPASVNSGDPESWMNIYSDWTGSASSVAGGHAVPDIFGHVTVTTSLTGSDLVLKFAVPDATKTQKATGDPLVVGDQVLVELDTRATRDANLVAGKSFRYQITISAGPAANTNKVSAATVSTTIGGNNWGGATPITIPATNAACPGSYPNGCAALTASGSSNYSVELRIPLTAIGLSNPPANEIGLAILVGNDLGHQDAASKWDQTAVTFPFADMPAGVDPFNDPGLVVPSTSGPLNIWNKPDHWGAAVFTAPTQGTGNLLLSHTPAVWFSDSIRLSQCDVGRFEDILKIPMAADGNPAADQTNMPNWYKYLRDDPCKMGVWVAANNSASTTRQARMLVLWADGGLATKTWRVVALTPPINFGPGKSTTHVVWDKVPSKGSVPGGTTHPCLRVYLVPVDSTHDNLIVDGMDPAAYEAAVGIPANLAGFQSAQMNFTNLANGGCTSVPCKQPVIISQNFNLLRVLGIDSAVAQTRPTETGGEVTDATPLDPDRHPEPSTEKAPWFGVAVTGFAVPSTPSPLPYVFLDAIGGVGWAVPYSVAQEEALTLGFNITNPAVLYRDFTTSPATDVPATKRTILLSVVAHAPAGMALPKFTVNGTATDLEPGATVPGTINVDKAAGGDGLPGWIKCLLSGNIWCWLILIIIIIVIIIIFRRRRPGP